MCLERNDVLTCSRTVIQDRASPQPTKADSTECEKEPDNRLQRYRAARQGLYLLEACCILAPSHKNE